MKDREIEIVFGDTFLAVQNFVPGGDKAVTPVDLVKVKSFAGVRLCIGVPKQGHDPPNARHLLHLLVLRPG